MAANTTWSPAPYLGNQTWLLTDNAVVKAPPLEASTSGRRVRIAGQTKSFSSNDVSESVLEAIREIANQRDAKPWVQLDDPDANLAHHSNATPNRVGVPQFSRAKKFHLTATTKPGRYERTDIAFEFVSEECPTVTAIVWAGMGVDSCDDNIFQSGITYRHMHQDNAVNSNYRWWTNGHSWTSPYGYYDNHDDAEASKLILSSHQPIPGVEFLNRDFGKESRKMVTEGLKLLRDLTNVETIELPVWRDPSTPTLMKFKASGRTTWSKSLYQEMLEYVQTGATVERIQQNMKLIQRDMQMLGMVTHSQPGQGFFQAVEEASGHDLVCHMIPVTLDDDEEATSGPKIVQDHEHTVSIDIKTGTLVVNCLKESAEVIEAWNFQRFQAELKGELDAFLGFAKQQQQKRAKRRVTQIVKDRTMDDEDLEIPAFASQS